MSPGTCSTLLRVGLSPFRALTGASVFEFSLRIRSPLISWYERDPPGTRPGGQRSVGEGGILRDLRKGGQRQRDPRSAACRDGRVGTYLLTSGRRYPRSAATRPKPRRR
jgi:hypothetical protein